MPALRLGHGVGGAIRGGPVGRQQGVEVEGRNDEIATTSRKSVTIVDHPGRKFWDLNHPPKDVWPPISATFDL